MRVSLRWIAEYTELPDLPEGQFFERLTLAGLEVEGVTKLQAEGVRVGQVLGVEPHPAAENLKLCTVGVGKEEFLTVCGAPNVSRGMLVPFALPGALLPKGPCGGDPDPRGEKRGNDPFPGGTWA
jgi:phenylalanyl-tRNA synthetase beta chain